MKKILCAILVLVSVLSFFACGDEKYRTYKERNLEFKYLSDMESLTVPNADVLYSNGKLKISFKALSNAYFEEEMNLSPHTTVCDYVDLYMLWNNLDGKYTYIEEEEKVIYERTQTEPDVYYGEEGELIESSTVNYDYYMFYRKESGICIVRIYCDVKYKETYKEDIKYIAESFKIGG